MNSNRLQELSEFLRTRREGWPYEGRYRLESFGPHKFIAKIDTELAGLAWADVTASGEAMMHMNLKKDYAEYGIGTELLETLMADLQEADFGTIRYEIDSQYYAYQIYHNMGFSVESQDEERVRFIWKR